MERPDPAVTKAVQAALTATQPQPIFNAELTSLHQWQAEQARLEAERIAAYNRWLESIRGRMAPFGTYANGTYAYGECTWYVASRVSVPPFLGNAASWGYTLGWTVHENAVIGAIAWTTAGYWGHVALVEDVRGDQVYISEMNYNGMVGVVNYRWVPTSEFSYLY